MIQYNISCNSRNWYRRKKIIEKLVFKVIRHNKELKFKKNIDYYCNIILTDDKSIKNLNKDYKNINKKTDVLTFVSKIKIKNKKQMKYFDIFFSFETIYKDSNKNKVYFYNHLTHLLIHSFLHVNDFVHKKLKDYLMMKKIEISVLKKLKIDNPYI